MLDKFLLRLSHNHSNVVKRRTVAASLGGNYIDLLTITNPESGSSVSDSSMSHSNSRSEKQKKLVFITARVHPGETPSSFVVEGLIKYLISSCPEANALRNNFVFKVIPMLNPDGVINGNYRCSLSGNDLNRVWDRADRNSHPEIFHAKKHILESGKCFLFVDLHAHSKKKGIFMYGC